MTKICVLGGCGLIGSSILIKKNLANELCYTSKNNSVNIDYPTVSANAISDFDKIEQFINFQKPETIINTISNSNPNYCEINQKNTFDLNVKFVEKIFNLCQKKNIKLIHFSTDYVFDGKKEKYLEKDKPNPINYYGFTKFLSEKIVLQDLSNAVIRTSLVYGKNQNARFFNFVLNNLKSKNQIEVFDDIFFSPTLVDDITDAIFTIIKDSMSGIFHVSGINCSSKYEFAKKIALIFDLDDTLIKPISIKTLKSKMKYPTKTCLDSSSSSERLQQKFHSIDSGLLSIKNSSN